MADLWAFRLSSRTGGNGRAAVSTRSAPSAAIWPPASSTWQMRSAAIMIISSSPTERGLNPPHRHNPHHS
jgi:hypothetical protein